MSDFITKLLTDYCRSVTIVANNQNDLFHPKTVQFRHFFEVKNVLNFPNSSRQEPVKTIVYHTSSDTMVGGGIAKCQFKV